LRVGLEAGVDTVGESHARSSESGLLDGVVLLQEHEAHSVTRGGHQELRGELEVSTTNNDLVT